jgi:hypothetical protein
MHHPIRRKEILCVDNSRLLAIRKASLKFDALVGDRQVIANESFGVSRGTPNYSTPGPPPFSSMKAGREFVIR